MEKTEQWKLKGKCDECIKYKNCSKPCKINKKKTKNKIYIDLHNKINSNDIFRL